MDGPKTGDHAKAGAALLLILASLAIAETLSQPASVYPDVAQAAANHSNQNIPFEVILFVNATAGNLSACNASITLNDPGINFTAYAGASNRTHIGDIANQSVANATWSLTAPGRGAHYVNFSVDCNNNTAYTIIYVDLLNVTNVSLTPGSIKYNDSYFEAYRNASYNISVTVGTLNATQNLTNVIVYLNDAASNAYYLNASNQPITSTFNASANAPAGTIYSYNVTTNDSQKDRWTQPLIIRVISPLNVTISLNDSAIVANQSFTLQATASNLGTANLTNVSLAASADGGLTVTNTSCEPFPLSPGSSNSTCVWTFNSTTPSARANITVTGTTNEGDNQNYTFGLRIYGIGTFSASNVNFGTHNHNDSTVVQNTTITALTEDLWNFRCAGASGDLNASISCSQGLNLTQSSSSQYNISLAIPTYTSKGVHTGNISIYAENAAPQNVSYSVNITGMRRCSGDAITTVTTRSGSSTQLRNVTVQNRGNVPINFTCNGCTVPTSGTIIGTISPNNSSLVEISVPISSTASTTSTLVTINCTSADASDVDGGSGYGITVSYPAGDTGTTTTTTTTTTTQTTQTQQNATPQYTYTVALFPTTATIKKGESSEFTIEVKNTGTAALANLTVSGESTLQFTVSPTKIASVPKLNSGYSKITAIATTATTPGTYTMKAKVCRTTTSCVTSSESTITIPDDTPPPATVEEANTTPEATEAPEEQKAGLNISTDDNTIRLVIENATNAGNLTAYIEVLDAAGKVVYNSTRQTQTTNGTAGLPLPETLKAGNYTLKVALRDLSGNTIAEKTITYVAKEKIEPQNTAAAITAGLPPSVINGLLLIIMVLFIVAGIKTSRIGMDQIKNKFNLRQKILEKAQTAYQQGNYQKAREYKATAEIASKAELDLSKKIDAAETRIVQLYKEGKHMQARKEKDALTKMKKELELLREQNTK